MACGVRYATCGVRVRRDETEKEQGQGGAHPKIRSLSHERIGTVPIRLLQLLLLHTQKKDQRRRYQLLGLWLWLRPAELLSYACYGICNGDVSGAGLRAAGDVTLDVSGAGLRAGDVILHVSGVCLRAGDVT